MSKEQRQSSKLWEPRSFDMYKNAITLMIAMLGHLELNTEISDADMKTAEFDDYREISRNDKDTNGMLAMM